MASATSDAAATIPTVEPATLMTWLTDGDELALLDAREEGAFSNEHLFHAASLPLSQLELRLEALVPRRTTRVVWCDDGETGEAQRAAARTLAAGWTDVHVLAGGTAAWGAAGGELYSGVNVPSKAFGELIEHARGTPRVSATELQELVEAGTELVILDSRPRPEYRRISIPGGIDCPGAELVHRVKEVAPDPATLVVVNCAGRTRSIIGAQSLINAGLENRVVALENGTMGWQLAGFEPASGATDEAPEPGPDARRWAETAAAEVADRYGVERVGWDTVTAWLDDATRTTYLLDVRTDEEFEAGHVDRSRHAPGGQLVQATDVYVATRNARLVLIDDEGQTRAQMTASWLRQLGWTEAVVLAGGLPAATGAGARVVEGKTPRPSLARVSAPVIRPPALAERLAADPDGVVVIDIGTSTKYRHRGHIPGSWWGVRSRLDQARAAIGEASTIVLTSTDGTLAKLAVVDAAQHWPDAEILALAAGNKGWRHAGYDMEPGFDRATTTPDDQWRVPYAEDTPEAREAAALAYLDWETALLDQIERDPLVSFPLDPRT
jgi:rhodanese-related sulfurtransferase